MEKQKYPEKGTSGDRNPGAEEAKGSKYIGQVQALQAKTISESQAGK